eukprot:371436_1
MYKMEHNETLNISEQCTATVTTTQIPTTTLTTEIGSTTDSDNQLVAVIEETVYTNTKIDSMHVDEHLTTAIHTVSATNVLQEFNNGSMINTSHIFSNWWYVAGGFAICCLLFCSVLLIFLYKMKRMMQSFKEMADVSKIQVGAQSPTSPAKSPTSTTSVNFTSAEIYVEEKNKIEDDFIIKIQDEDFIVKTLETIGEMTSKSHFQQHNKSQDIDDISISDAIHMKGLTMAFASDQINESKEVHHEYDNTVTSYFDGSNIEYDESKTFDASKSNSDNLIKQQHVAIKSFKMNKQLEEQFNALSSGFNTFVSTDVEKNHNGTINVSMMKIEDVDINEELEVKKYNDSYSDYMQKLNGLKGLSKQSQSL